MISLLTNCAAAEGRGAGFAPLRSKGASQGRGLEHVERPILFSAPMVRAVLDGTKTQTRRALREQPTLAEPGHIECGAARFLSWPAFIHARLKTCPFGKSGDRLWVRESFCIGYPVDADATEYSALPWTGADAQRDGKAFYRASFAEKPDEARMVWRPSIHMPRWASRIDLEVTAIRIERLQDISEADAKAEGAAPLLAPPDGGSQPHVEGYRALWQSLGGDWQASPWVWVVEFRRLL